MKKNEIRFISFNDCGCCICWFTWDDFKGVQIIRKNNIIPVQYEHGRGI
jgi:hypothetical protein